MAIDIVFEGMRKPQGWQGCYATDPSIVALIMMVARDSWSWTRRHVAIALEDDHIHIETRVSTRPISTMAVFVNLPPRGRYPSEVHFLNPPYARVAHFELRPEQQAQLEA